MSIKTRVLSIAGAAIIALGTITGVTAAKPEPVTADAKVEVAVSAPENGHVQPVIIAGTSDFNAVTGSLAVAGTSQGGLLLTVEDTRFTREGWSIEISATDFIGTETDATIGVENFLVTPKVLAVKAGDDEDVDPAPGSVTLGDDPQVILSAEEGSGSGSYELPLSGTVTIPANTMADTYVSTVTVTATSAP